MRRAIQASLLVLAASLFSCRGTTAPEPVGSAHPAGVLSSRISGFTGRPFGIRVSSRGVAFVTQQDANSVARFDLADAFAGSSVPVGADPGDVLFTRDGRTAFVSNFQDGTVRVLHVESGQSTRLLYVDPANAYRLALAPDESRLYVTSTSGRLYSVDPLGVEAARSTFLGGALQGIAMGHDGLHVIVSNTGGGVWRLDARTLAVVASTTLSTFATQEIVLAPNGTELYVADESGSVHVLNASTLVSNRRVLLPGLRPFGLAVTPDGAFIYVASSGTGQVGILDRRTDAITQRFPVGGVPRRIAFDAAGTTAVVSNEGNWVDVIR